MDPYHEDLRFTENSLLASVLHDNTNAKLIDLDESDFFFTESRRVWGAMQFLIRKGKPIEPTGLSELLTRKYGGRWPEYLDVVMHDSIPTMPLEYATAVRTLSNQRRARAICKECLESGDYETALYGLLGLGSSDPRHMHEGHELTNQTLEAMDSQPMPSVKTGFTKFDHRIGGLHNGDLIVIGARPGVGKTAIACNIAINSGVPFVFFSAEQPAEQIQKRFLAAKGGIVYEHLRTHRIEEADRPKLAQASTELRKVPYWVYDQSAPGIADINREARKLHVEHGIELVVVDYVQRLKREKKNAAHEEIGENIRALKDLARDLKVPVVALAQLQRRADDRGADLSISDLKDSGDIEQEADLIALLYRERAYKPDSMNQTAEMLVRKNRHGPPGKVLLRYAEQFVRFEDMP